MKSPFEETQSAEEPFDPRPRKVLTVSELSRQIQSLLEGSFPAVWVEGEVSQPTLSTKGHMYFSLKDAGALIRCVVWRDAREGIRFNLEHGLQVICLGRVSLYPQRGDYQLYVEQVEPKGMGALQLAFEQLKEKLQKEGLFDEERKRPLPDFPARVGVVTSPTGAAIQDILKILRGSVEVFLRPVRVQGEGSAEAVAQAIKELNACDRLDLLIVGRGGGSLEDLWAFNEEAVARAIFRSKLPVISAVGHEKDVTISDLVADVRAPTPTKAAEMVVTQRSLFLDRLLAVLENPAFTEPEEWLKGFKEEVEGLEARLVASSPQAFILHQAEKLHGFQQSLVTGMSHTVDRLSAQMSGLAGRLNALSPLAVLDRGYSITFNEKGQILKEAGSVKPGQTLRTRLHQGEIKSRVESIEEKI
ncbi:MAG: exodeoxyribonuclease VII large subunit [Candidatus Omnitrophica bacterium]|nr:exodeoxyribonuclease VII large subunit [Candidatus Omnitrophota bacterium]